MRTLICLCLLSSMAMADESSKAAKIAELLQLTGARQFLHEVDGKLDQEEAVRAFGRFYSDNVTEPELDAILAYYRSPAGQKDVSASRAALARVQRDKRTPAPKQTVVTNTQGPPLAAPAAKGTVESLSASTARPATTAASTTVVAAPTVSTVVASAPAVSGVGTAPRAPDGRVVASPSSPEACDVAPSTTPLSKGRSIVCVCTDDKGALTRDPVIAESSGDPRVDSGALKMARIDSGRYIPPTVDGHPQSACFRFAIDFSHHE